jgi:hypothetical protein
MYDIGRRVTLHFDVSSHMEVTSDSWTAPDLPNERYEARVAVI